MPRLNNIFHGDIGLFGGVETITPIKDLNFKPKVLQIFSRDILEKIRKKIDGWQEGVPDGVSDIIIKKKLFGMK